MAGRERDARGRGRRAGDNAGSGGREGWGPAVRVGDNGRGRLGNATNTGTATANPTPALVKLPGGASVATLARGPHAYHSLVVLTDLAVASASVPGGIVGVAYGARLQASGGTAPMTGPRAGCRPG